VFAAYGLFFVLNLNAEMSETIAQSMTSKQFGIRINLEICFVSPLGEHIFEKRLPNETD